MNNWEHSAQTLSIRTEEKEIDLDKYKPGTFVYTWGINMEESEIHLQRSLVTCVELCWNSFGTVSATCKFYSDHYATNYRYIKDYLVDEALIDDNDCFLKESDAIKNIKKKGYGNLPIRKLYLNYPEQTKNFTKPFFKSKVKKFSEIDKYYEKFEI